MTLANVKIPSRSEIDAAVTPFVTKRMPVESSEWREIFDRESRKERKIFRKQKWRSLMPWAGHAREQSSVSEHYETHWSELPWPRTKEPQSGEKPIVCIWDREGMLIRRFGRKRAHHLLFARILRELDVKTALEVGAGNGINLLIMSTLFPEIKFSGVELTEAGVRVASSIQKEAQLPNLLQEFSVEPIRDATAHQRVNFRQGDASQLPFGNKQFDLVFTFQALEQMQAVRDKAVSEIARVAGKYVICTEPFLDFNQSEIQKHYREARGYLNLPSSDLPKFGLQPVFQFGDWPHKLNLGVGLIAATTR